MQDVAQAAGVSKGALFHHFSSKQVLVDEAIGALIGEFEARVRALLQENPEGHGRFSRAYVQANFEHLLQQEQDNDIGLTLGNLMEPACLRTGATGSARCWPSSQPKPATHGCTRRAALPMATGPRPMASAGRGRTWQCIGHGRTGPETVRPAVSWSAR
nr:TetR/AcrR family transcriptional regulator [Stenotrophomonas maltophilia]